jgi:fermentation-respiration switch protein FrsA (DUF1100 family)
VNWSRRPHFTTGQPERNGHIRLRATIWPRSEKGQKKRRRFARLLARRAVTIASARDRRVGAAVIFYGFVPSDDQRIQTDHLPPLLVLHGSSDENISLESGREIVNLAHRLGGQAELVVYPEGHRLSTWKEPAAHDAVSRTISFFRSELIGR